MAGGDCILLDTAGVAIARLSRRERVGAADGRAAEWRVAVSELRIEPIERRAEEARLCLLLGEWFVFG